jgi:GNAT superfamily N-acetyltransferase
VTQEVQRNYLEIKSIQDLNEVVKPNGDFSLKLLETINFQLNKFFYKNIGKKHKWIDRLVWTDAQWIDYVSNKNVKTYVFKFKDDLAGFFELISHNEKKEIEIAYFGLLEEFQNKKLGSYLLSQAIQKSFNESLNKSINRVWVHTCSLDHKNALSNYIARGMKIFKTETIKI